MECKHRSDVSNNRKGRNHLKVTQENLTNLRGKLVVKGLQKKDTVHLAHNVKFLPRTGHEDPEGEQMYSYTLPSTSAIDGGVGGQRHVPAALPPVKDLIPIL